MSDNGIYECCVNGIEGESSRSIIIDGNSHEKSVYFNWIDFKFGLFFVEIRNSSNSKEENLNHNRKYSATGRESNEWILKNQKGSGRSFTETVSFSYRQESKEREARSNSTQLFNSFESKIRKNLLTS